MLRELRRRWRGISPQRSGYLCVKLSISGTKDTEGCMSWSGGCLCGTVRYETLGEPIWVGHCHCRSCQKHSGSAFTTGVMFRASDLVWDKSKPEVYKSSPGVERGFCPTCGSTLTFARLDRDEVTVLAGSLDNPNVISPSEHIFTEEQCIWLRLDDGLPSHSRFPPGGEDRESG
jgi:hypothetical protein